MSVGTGLGNETNRPTIFVAPFSAGSALRSHRSSIGDGIAESLINLLASSPKFGVLETTDLENIRHEITQGSDGWMETSQKTERGHWIGADYMLAGKIKRLEPARGSGGGIGLPIPGLQSGGKAKAEIAWRVVNTSTRKIVASGTTDSSEGKEKFSMKQFVGTIFNKSENPGDGIDHALEVVMAKLVDDLEKLNLPKTERRQATEEARMPEAKIPVIGLVEAVKPEFLIVGVGSKHGVKAGDKLVLYEVIPVKNAEGKTVFNEEKSIGEVEIQTCIEERSKVRYVSLAPPKEGWVVRCKR